MTAAAVISFAEARPSDANTQARQQLHAYLDGGLDRAEAYMPEDIPSRPELTHAVLALRQELTGQLTAALVAQRHAQVLPQRPLPCPHCQRLLPARPAPPRTVHTMVGEGSLARPDVYGPPCQHGCAPLAEALPRSERRTPWDLQQAAARLAAEVPCATAQELFAPLPGLAVRDHAIPAVTGDLSDALGGLAVSPTAADLAHRVAEMAAGKTGRPLLVLGIDGA